MMNTLGSLHIQKQANSGVTAAIQQASARTGVDFGYLVRQADIESSMNPNAKAKSSSATGLYQFIEQTWLQMVKTHGAEHGMDNFADAIKQNSDGTYTVPNRAMKNQILNLRRDAQTSAIMAAELASDNHDTLEANVSKDVTSTDLYLAHFLGAQGASNFLNSMQKNAWAPAASLFPEAARANKAVFYENGKPLSLQAVYNKFDAKFDSNASPVTQVASTQGSYAKKVVLPHATEWSNPFESAPRMAGIKALAKPVTSATRTAGTATTSTSAELPQINRGFLSAQADLLMMAQKATFIHYDHNDNSRYNA